MGESIKRKNILNMWWKNSTTRHNFSSVAYGLWFCIYNLIAIVVLQGGINDEHEIFYSLGFVGKLFLGKFMVINEFLLVGILYFVVLMLVNRFWMASQAFLDIAVIITIIERFKLVSRSETIVPADLNFLSGGNAGDLAAWLPDDALWIIVGAIIFIIVTTALTMVLSHRDTRRGVVYSRKKLVNALVRLVSVIVVLSFLVSFVMSMASIGSWSNNVVTFFGDSPKLWDSKIDAQQNGTAVGFARLVNPKIMDEPSSYSEKTMKEVASRYEKLATQINETRTNNLNNSTVIYLLSESFSDPSRVPGLKINKDVMPNVRTIKASTTSGLMLSSGYGGGTANLEYMALTGLSLVNFSPSLSSPYQQLVPSAQWTPTINQFWNISNSYAFHPYQSNMYSRNVNYKKFGFSQFWTLDKPNVISPQTTLGTSSYVSDKSTYTAVLNSLKKHVSGQNYFYQVVTMQNHMPYKNYYVNNEVKAESTTGTPLGDSEKTSIETFSKGVEYTDEYTKDFLDQLDKLDQPISVVFYGDHLPGAYKSAAKDENNSLALHETDYFIWSNKASGIDNEAAAQNATNSAYTSPNYFSAQLAEHMNAKVSPYLAFLSALHEKVPAMEPAVVNKIQGWTRIPDGQALYLDNQGNYIDVSKADDQTQQLLNDYKLIQYDITTGKHYLKDLDFMTIAQ